MPWILSVTEPRTRNPVTNVPHFTSGRGQIDIKWLQTFRGHHTNSYTVSRRCSSITINWWPWTDLSPCLRACLLCYFFRPSCWRCSWSRWSYPARWGLSSSWWFYPACWWFNLTRCRRSAPWSSRPASSWSICYFGFRGPWLGGWCASCLSSRCCRSGRSDLGFLFCSRCLWFFSAFSLYTFLIYRKKESKLTSKRQAICSRRHSNFFLLIFFRENKFWHLVWILCLAENSHEMSRQVLSEK